ncbi:MAG: LytR C-terminal domain-containing protein, partial [Dehalococcoidia bacterium]|nr:LytR C-terminal domain-containing protein [Dehalococcoidia bacterium]
TIDKALARRLVNVDQLLDLWSRYEGAIDTDVNDLRAPGFAALAAQIDPTQISALSLGYATVPWVSPDGQSVLLVDDTLVQDVVQALFSDQALTQEAALVEIQNGAGSDGLATQVVDYLAEFGFSADSLAAANAVDGAVRPQTVIIDYTGKDHTVQRLASLLGVLETQIRVAGPDDAALPTIANVDVLVILGTDAQARDFTLEETSGG